MFSSPRALDESAQVAGGQHAFDAAAPVDDDGNAAAFRNHDDCLPHGVALFEDRQVLTEHDLFDPDDQLAPEGAARMNPGEVLALEPLLLQQRHRQRVAEHERRRRARRRREIVRTGLLAHAGVERHVAVSAKRRRRVPGDGDGSYTEALQMCQKRQELVRFAALGDQNGDVVTADDPEVAVDAVDRMEEVRGGAGGRQRRGDLSADQPGLADAGDDHAAASTRRSARTARANSSPRRSSRPASASRSRRTTRRPRSTISPSAHAAPAFGTVERAST